MPTRPRTRKAPKRNSSRYKSMSWGTLPELPAFEKHVRWFTDEVDEPVIGPPGDVYHMELVGKEKEWAQTALETLFATGTPLAFDQFTPKKYPHKYGLRFHDVASLHKFILALLTVDEMEAEAQGEKYSEAQDTPGSLASSIMSTLGYEWI